MLFHQFYRGIYRRYIDRKFLWAIPTLLFLVAGKASRVDRWITSETFHDVQNANCLCTGHATMSTERANDYSARTFSCYRAKPKCNFTVRPLHERSTMLGRLLQTVWVCFFLRRNENEILFGNSQKCLRQWSEWNFWRAINAQCVTRVGTVFFGKIPWRASPWIFHLRSVTQGFHTRASIRQLLRNFWFGTIARKGACTVISRKFPRSVDIVAWPV